MRYHFLLLATTGMIVATNIFAKNRICRRSRTQPIMTVDSSIISIGAGSAAGAIGVLAAYPFDSLKTKAQTFREGL